MNLKIKIKQGDQKTKSRGPNKCMDILKLPLVYIWAKLNNFQNLGNPIKQAVPALA
jgi:hypothetical protein